MLFYWIIGGISFILLGLVSLGVVIGMHLGGVMPEWLEKIISILIVGCIYAAIGLILTTINKYLPYKLGKHEKAILKKQSAEQYGQKTQKVLS